MDIPILSRGIFKADQDILLQQRFFPDSRQSLEVLFCDIGLPFDLDRGLFCLTRPEQKIRLFWKDLQQVQLSLDVDGETLHDKCRI